MKILVCVSNVPDTTTKIKVARDNSKLELGSVQWIINPWDELALTRVLELKEKSGGFVESVDVASVGKLAEATIRKALAVGADKGFRVDFDPADSYQTAVQLAEVLKKEPHEVTVCGVDSSDYNGSSVGTMLAELLNLPSVSAVSSLDIDNSELAIRREIDGGYEVISCGLPVVIIVQKGIAIEPRIPSMRGVMQARTKPLITIAPSAVDKRTEFLSYELPGAKAACKKIAPDNMRELVRLLHEEAKVI